MINHDISLTGYPHQQPGVSAITVAYNAGDDIAHCLAPLVAMRARGEIAEVIVVDDASSDDTALKARRHGADHIEQLVDQHGAAGARNVGARISRGDVIWFVDADVVVHDDAARVLSHVLTDRTIDAVFGSYGDRPTQPNFLSQYKNLIHHDTHQRSAGDATTFWTGCGAVRRAAFERIDGFDAERFRHMGMEDIDFGYRLNAAGASIRLEPALQGEHRKRWTLINLLRVEIFHRALPWSRLMLENDQAAPTLNIDHGERIRALLAGCVVLAFILAPFTGAWLIIVVCLIVVLANRRLLRFFYDKRGAWFAVRALLFHQLYYLYSSATFVYAWIEKRLDLKPASVS